MLVTYTAPNRAHHYTYALALHQAGCLQRFIAGASRFGPRSAFPELGEKLLRADHLQNFYLASLRFNWPSLISEELTYLSKMWLDRCSTRDALQSDVFLYYSGAGLRTQRALRNTPAIGVMEAVNSHVLVQERILREEHERLLLPLKGFHRREVERRTQEIIEADGIICPSSFVRDSFIAQGKAPESVRTVTFGLDLSANSLPADKPTDVFRVLFVGQINLRKGLRYLLEAFRLFSHPRKELWVVGPMTEQSGIADVTPPTGTRFLGVLKGAELENAYRSCHVFVLPTIEEGLALVIGEALSHGLPVIATENSGAMDLFTDGSTGFIVPIRSPAAIAEKLQLLADDPAKLEAMSNQARLPGPGRHSWETTGHHLVKALRDLTAQSKS